MFRNGVPDSVNTYNTPNVVENHLLDQAVYLQDKWQASRRLTINAGVRVQKSIGWVPAGCQVETLFIAARCFDKVQDVPNWLNAAPRFGFIYDLFGDGKTALKGSANRYYLTNGVTHVARVNPMRTTNDTRAWVDANNDEIPQLTELGPSTGFNLGTTNRYAEDVKRPYANELSIEVERQLPLAVVLSVGYTYRATRQEIGSRNLLVPRESYIPLQVIEQTSGQAVTVYNQDPSTRGRFDVLFDNAPELNSSFKGLDITANKRMTAKWMLMTGLSFGKNLGDIYGTGDLNNPNNAFRRSRIEFDVPLSVKVSGAYELPYAISVSANAQHFTGFPEEDSVVVGANTVRLTQVTQTVNVAPRGTNRLPSVNAFDMAIRKRFTLPSGMTAEPALEMFNLGNANTVQGRITTLGPAYHRATSIMRGRMLRFGLNVKF